MSKMTSGKCWLFNCPSCNNNKCIYYSNHKQEYYKCTKCGTKFEVKDNKILIKE